MRIGELARRTGVNPKTIRFYEEIGLLSPPQRTGSGYRTYGEEQVRQMEFILRAKRLGLSLEEIRDIIRIREGGEPPCVHVARLLERRLAELKRMQAELQELQRALEATLQRTRTALAKTDTANYCPIIEHSQVDPAPLPLAERTLKRRPRR